MALDLSVGIAVSAVVISLWIVQNILRPSRLAHVPKPPNASWLWGHEKIVFDASAGTAYHKWIKDYGPTFKIGGALAKPDILILGDPTGVAHIFQRRIYDYPHTPVVRSRIARLLGKSLGWVEGESEHKRMRQLVSPSLSPESIRKGASDVFDAASTMQSLLAETLLKSGGSKTVNIIDWTSSATLDVIGRFGFAHSFGAGRSEEAATILSAWRNMAKTATSKFGFYALMLLRRWEFVNHLPLKALKDQAKVRNTIRDGVAQELVRRDTANAELVKGNDLLSCLLGAYTSGKMPKDELLDHISMFIVSGSETTSQTLGFALWELARDSRVQDKLREEFAAFPDPTYNDFQTKMPYLDAILREALRLRPPAPYLERIADVDDVIPLRHPITAPNGTQITELPVRKGQAIIIPVLSANQLAWDDGSVFRPERWLGPMPAQDLMPHGWSNLLSFSDGPRNCIGFRLAIFEFKVLMHTLITHFRFRDSGAEIEFKVASSMQAWVKDKAEAGPQLPVTVELL